MTDCKTGPGLLKSRQLQMMAADEPWGNSLYMHVYNGEYSVQSEINETFYLPGFTAMKGT